LDAFDPERLRLNGSLAMAPLPTPKRPPRHRPGEPFLKGPVPWHWLEAAAGLPGKALAVGLWLWREAGCKRNRTVKVCQGAMGLHVSRYAARRALRFLESAGLVKINRRPGCGLEVTLLDVDQPS
jgi:hypothetical protein